MANLKYKILLERSKHLWLTEIRTHLVGVPATEKQLTKVTVCIFSVMTMLMEQQHGIAMTVVVTASPQPQKTMIFSCQKQCYESIVTNCQNILKEFFIMEKIIAKITALGVPGLVLLIAVNAAGYAGGAAIVAALSALGPGGIVGGIATLGVIGLISHGIAEYGMEAIFRAVVKELIKKGETKESILAKISKYPISKSLKCQLREEVNKTQ